MVALATFPIYVSGLILRTLGEAFHPSALAFAAGLAGATLEIIAILTFGWIIAETLLAPTARRSASDRYILAATFWFAAQAVYDVFLFWLTSTAGSTEEFVRRIATFQPPLRDIQVHGFAALMILGASQRYLPGMIGLGRVPEKLADILLVVFNAAVIGEAAGHLGRRLGERPSTPGSSKHRSWPSRSEAAPETIAVFERMGFPAITNRLLRETVARTITIRQACALKGIDESRLIAALDDVLEGRTPAGRRFPTPVQFTPRLTPTS